MSCDVRVRVALAAGELEPFRMALHAWDRRLGVIFGGPGERTQLRLLTPMRDEPTARQYAIEAIAGAARLAEIDAEVVETAQILAIECRPRDVTGGPRTLDAAPEGSWRTVDVPGYGRLQALPPQDPLDEWALYLASDPGDVRTGRWLLAVIDSLLQLPHGRKDDWVYELIEELAGRKTPLGVRYPCPCCDFLTLEKPPTGTYQLCPVCFWEDDNIQFADPEYEGGANQESLLEARDNFQRLGASTLRHPEFVRPPLPEEHP